MLTAGSHRRAQRGRGTLRKVSMARPSDTLLYLCVIYPRISYGAPKTVICGVRWRVLPASWRAERWYGGWVLPGACTAGWVRWVGTTLPHPPSRLLVLPGPNPSPCPRICVHPVTPGPLLGPSAQPGSSHSDMALTANTGEIQAYIS